MTTKPYTPIVATLGYVLSPDGTKVLMIHRNSRPEDQHLGKYNGLGGKLDPVENVAAGMKRELREEAGIEVEKMVLRGTVNWPGFGKQGEDWLGFIFRIDQWSGTCLESNPEGALEWVTLESLLRFEVPLWDGDKFFLPLVFGAEDRHFHGVMPYENGRAVSWSFDWV
jgi:8-oxo-dGTP diphosphatase